jgi:hypothetical protein
MFSKLWFINIVLVVGVIFFAVKPLMYGLKGQKQIPGTDFYKAGSSTGKTVCKT